MGDRGTKGRGGGRGARDWLLFWCSYAPVPLGTVVRAGSDVVSRRVPSIAPCRTCTAGSAVLRIHGCVRERVSRGSGWHPVGHQLRAPCAGDGAPPEGCAHCGVCPPQGSGTALCVLAASCSPPVHSLCVLPVCSGGYARFLCCTVVVLVAVVKEEVCEASALQSAGSWCALIPLSCGLLLRGFCGCPLR